MQEDRDTSGCEDSKAVTTLCICLPIHRLSWVPSWLCLKALIPQELEAPGGPGLPFIPLQVLCQPGFGRDAPPLPQCDCRTHSSSYGRSWGSWGPAGGWRIRH